MVLTIALIIVAAWIGVLFVVLAMCKAAGRADADEERYRAEQCDEVSRQSLTSRFDATAGDERSSIERAEIEREAERMRIELQVRPRWRLTRMVGTRRHRS